MEFASDQGVQQLHPGDFVHLAPRAAFAQGGGACVPAGDDVPQASAPTAWLSRFARQGGPCGASGPSRNTLTISDSRAAWCFEAVGRRRPLCSTSAAFCW